MVTNSARVVASVAPNVSIVLVVNPWAIAHSTAGTALLGGWAGLAQHFSVGKQMQEPIPVLSRPTWIAAVVGGNVAVAVKAVNCSGALVSEIGCAFVQVARSRPVRSATRNALPDFKNSFGYVGLDFVASLLAK